MAELTMDTLPTDQADPIITNSLAKDVATFLAKMTDSDNSRKPDFDLNKY